MSASRLFLCFAVASSLSAHVAEPKVTATTLVNESQRPTASKETLRKALSEAGAGWVIWVSSAGFRS